jgi:chemotaxis response regulator CheB
VKRIRVLVARMPTLLRDIVCDALARAPDVAVFHARGRRAPARSTILRVRPDVVVVRSERPGLDLAQGVWASSPGARVLVLARGGRSAVLFALRPEQVVLRDVSPEGLAAAIREDPVRPPGSAV